MFPDRYAAWLRALLLESDGIALDDARALVTVPPRAELGDFSTPAALRTPEPGRLADRVVEGTRALADVESAEVTGRGFVNVRLTPRALAGIVAELRALVPAPSRSALPPTSTSTMTSTQSSRPGLAAILDEYAWLTSLTAQARALAVVPALDDPTACARPAERRLLCRLTEAPHRGAQIPYLQEICALSRRTDPAATALPTGDQPVRPDHRASLAIALATRAVLGAGLAGTMAA